MQEIFIVAVAAQLKAMCPETLSVVDHASVEMSAVI
jgi:hypothetical protein